MNSTIYARVQGILVIEYPVTENIITERGHSLTTGPYYKVVQSEMPASNAFEDVLYTNMAVDHTERLVKISYHVRKRDLDDILRGEFSRSCVDGVWSPMDVTYIPSGIFDYFTKLVSKHMEDKLEAVVKEHYTSMDTLLGRYSNSSNPVWRKEAEFIQKSLDKLWADMIAYFAELKEGKKPLPLKIEEIESQFVIPTWADMQ